MDASTLLRFRRSAVIANSLTKTRMQDTSILIDNELGSSQFINDNNLTGFIKPSIHQTPNTQSSSAPTSGGYPPIVYCSDGSAGLLLPVPFVVPAEYNRLTYVLIGGGGSGGTILNYNDIFGGGSPNFGGGGGSGGIINTAISVTPGTSISVTLGRGANYTLLGFSNPPSYDGNNGSAGENTVMVVGATSYTATGGGGGGLATLTNGNTVGQAGNAGTPDGVQGQEGNSDDNTLGLGGKINQSIYPQYSNRYGYGGNGGTQWDGGAGYPGGSGFYKLTFTKV